MVKKIAGVFALKINKIFFLLIIFLFFFKNNVNSQILTQPQNLSKCYKSSGIIVLKSTLSSDKYQWQYLDTVWKNIKVDSNFNQVTRDTLKFLNAKGQTLNLNVRCLVDSAGLGKKTFISTTIKIKSFPQLIAGQIQSSQTKCFNYLVDTIKIKTFGFGGDSITQFKWQYRFSSSVYTDIGNPNDKFLYLGKQKKSLIIRMRIDSKSCGSKFSDSIYIKILDSLIAPKIGNNQLICFGSAPSSLNISSKAKGASDTFKYIWLTRTLGNGIFSVIDSMNNWTFQPKSLQKTTFYKLKAISQLGCGVIFSDSVVITVLKSIGKPKISKNQIICYNTQPNIIKMDSLAVGGNDTFNYNWQFKSTLGTWQDISAATNSYYQPQKLTSTTLFRIKAISSKGCGTVFSDSIKITVLKQITNPTISKNQNICNNTQPNQLKVDIKSTGGNDTFIYQYQHRLISSAWQDISGGVYLNYLPPNLQNTTFYRVKVTSTFGCETVYSDSIVVNVYLPLSVPTISQNQVICNNSQPGQIKVTNLAKGGNDSFEYNWEFTEIANNWKGIPNAVKSTFQPSTLLTSTYYRIRANSRVGCGTVVSDSIFIKVLPVIDKAITNIVNDSICFNKIPNVKIIKCPRDDYGFSDNQWYISNDSLNFKLTNDTGLVYAHLNQLPLTTGRYLLKVVSTSKFGCKPISSDLIAFTVLPKFVSPKISQNQIICYNSQPGKLEFKNSVSGASGIYLYQWQSSIDNINWSNLSNAINPFLQNSKLNITTYYRCIVKDQLCGSVFSDTTKIKVLTDLSKPILNNLSPICYNSGLMNNNIIKFKFGNEPKGGNDTFTNFVEYSLNGKDWKYLSQLPQNGFQENNLKTSKYYRTYSVSKFGCGTVYSDSVLLLVYDSFIAPIIGNNQTICEGDFLDKKLSIIKSHSNAGNSFKYNWQRLNSNQQWIDLLGYDTVHLNKMFYLNEVLRLKVISNENCGQIYSNAVEITVNNRPDTFKIEGSSEICRFALDKYYEINNRSEYNYDWISSFGLVSRGQGTHQVYIGWPNVTQTYDTIKLTRVDKTNGCSNVMKFPIIINKNQAPLPTAITQIKNTKILVCKDTTYNLNYTWGYLNKQTKVETIEKNGYLRYHEFQDNIDTNKNIYFVKTSLGNCHTTSFYKFDPWVLNSADININRFKIYPNPSVDGRFFIINYKSIEDNAIFVYDLNGKIINVSLINNAIDLSNFAKGIYILADKNGYYEHVLLINK